MNISEGKGDIMNLCFKAVTPENREEVDSLSILPEQEGFIETIDECLQEAAEISEWRPIGIYDGDTIIGFAMYGEIKDDKVFGERVWFDRLLIDKRYQGRGYGKEAVIKIRDLIKNEYDCDKIYLSVYDDNPKAIKIYLNSGFEFNGELDTKGERMMVYNCR